MSKVLSRNERRVWLASVVIAAGLLSAGVPDMEAAQGPPAATPAHNVLDLYKLHKDEYVTPDSPVLVEVGKGQYLSIIGQGAPGGPTFGRKVGVLYGAAFALKMRSRSAGRDYAVAPMEGLWWGSKKGHDFMDEPRETWNWKLLIRVPEFITDKDVSAATGTGAGQGAGAMQEIKLETLTEGRCVQVLHVGPYDQEDATIAAMMDFAKEKGLTLNGPHHEIYLSDPNRTEPAKLRTILRQPVKPAGD